MYASQWLRFFGMFGALLGSTLAFRINRSEAEETSSYVQIELPNQPDIGSTLPPALNELMIGCNQAGAISYLSTRSPGRGFELIFSGEDEAQGDASKRYDEVYVLRLRNRDGTYSPDTICLYFRNGYLAYKCIVPDRKVNPDGIFRREIKSGLQHPPNFRGLMEKVQWGEATEPHLETEPKGSPAHAEQTTKRAAFPKVRCGIALDGLPPSDAKEKGANVLVLFQNVGPSALSDDLLLVGFPIGPVVMVRADYPRVPRALDSRVTSDSLGQNCIVYHSINKYRLIEVGHFVLSRASAHTRGFASPT